MEVSGVFLAVIVEAVISFFLIKQDRSNQKSTYLNLYIITVILDFTVEYLVLKFHGNNSFIDMYPSSFRFLKGPLLLFAGRQILDKPIGKYYIHLICFFLMLVLNILHLSEGHFSLTFYRLYLAIFKLYPLYWAIYLVVCIVEQLKHKRKGISSQNTFIQFLFFVLIAMLFYVTANYSHKFEREKLRFIYTLSFFVQFGFLLRINYLEKKKSLYKDPFSPFENPVAESPGDQEKKKYKNTVLSDEYVATTNKEILHLFKEKKIFTNEDLKLDDLSELMQVSKNHLSQCISEGMQTTFYDLVNKYRIEEFLLT